MFCVVIFLFMQGGPSRLDTFDPKPMLNWYHGQPLPASIVSGVQLQFTKMDSSVSGRSSLLNARSFASLRMTPLQYKDIQSSSTVKSFLIKHRAVALKDEDADCNKKKAW